jgi:single-stranded DNA-binding protein
MAGINYVVLTGRLKADAVKHPAKDGGAFYTFTLYVDDYKMEDEKWRRTEGEIDLIVNETKAKSVESSLVKGALVAVEGRLAQRTWQGKDEKTHTNLLLRVQSIGPLEKEAGSRDETPEEEEVDAAELGL